VERPRSEPGGEFPERKMVELQLDLSEEERRILQEVLDAAVSDLRMEIADTDSYDFRQMLKGRKLALMKVLAAVSDADTTANTP
jgi:hypothetical protein